MQVTTASDEATSMKPGRKMADDLSSAFGCHEFKVVVGSTTKCVDDILNGPSKNKRSKSAIQRLTWPFIKDEMNEHITRPERVKSWFIFAMFNGNLGYTNKSYNEVCRLTQLVTLD